VPKAIFSCDVPVAILEDQNRRFVDLDRSMLILIGSRVVHVRLFASGNAAIDLTDETLLQKLEQNETRARIEHLFDGGPIVFVLRSVFAVVDMATPR
jgi:hypothetical protein